MSIRCTHARRIWVSRDLAPKLGRLRFARHGQAPSTTFVPTVKLQNTVQTTTQPVAVAMDATPRADEPDSRNSLRHILAAEPSAMDDARPSASPADTPAPDDMDVADAPDKAAEDRNIDGDNDGNGDGARPHYTATTTTTRRNANGSVSSVYSGNKIKHLKKDDGIPLWRRDIQFDFLKLVFEDDRTVFTKQSEPQSGPSHTFADIYLDAMAKSSKCSKILKDKLLTERPAAVNMAMVCLLVNVGRMNTTLNCGWLL